MKEKQMRIGILTSGGDAPGMNAVIRAVVRTGLHYNMRVYGIKTGYEGLFKGDIEEMSADDVSGIIHHGGTILRTARCSEMMTEEGQARAAEICKVMRLDAIIVIGGDGSFKGAASLARQGVGVVCIPATIDLDMECSEYTIGFDTAVNTAADAIIRIRDTSSSHERCSVVEVMGRNAGYLALWCGLTGAAEEVLIPEYPVDVKSVTAQILSNRAKGKRHNLIVVAEGIGDSVNLSKEIERVLGIEARGTVLGHLQRGGTPTAIDRMHATVMGHMAVEAIKNKNVNKVVVVRGGKHELLDLEEAFSIKREYDPKMYELTKIMAV
ncbi:MAG: 6-phosphofructokinase [Defluviitaleaceae bacterium]|nr:6-phosphofructokinase [Defluviitaleaceae bacterium]